MNKVALCLTFFIITLGLNPNEIYSQDKKQSRKAKKEAREIEMVRQFENTAKLVDKLDFVLKAENIADKSGFVYYVDPILNFIIFDTIKTTVQLGTGLSIGDNGIGGKTAEGKVINLKYKKNEKLKNFYISFYLSTITARYKLDITISSNGNATAFLSTINGGSTLKFVGKIYPVEGSDIYKGAAHY